MNSPELRCSFSRTLPPTLPERRFKSMAGRSEVPGERAAMRDSFPQIAI